jgi:hypothetical protein
MELGGHRTGRAAAEAALREYVHRLGVEAFFELAGTIDYDEDYDYKAARRRGMNRIPEDGDDFGDWLDAEEH